MEIIGEYAFWECNRLSSATIPNYVKTIGRSAFEKDVIIYVNRRTDALLAIWKYGATPYDINSQQILLPPAISSSSTQTTITYQISNIYPELEYSCDGMGDSIGNNEYLITGLKPEYQYPISLTVRSTNNWYKTTTNATTAPVCPIVNDNTITASSISVKGCCDIEGNANVISRLFVIDGKEIEGEEAFLHGLNPNTSYNCKYKLQIEYADGYMYSCEGSKEITTAQLNLTTQQPKVISAGNVIVAAESNLDDEETNVGFEWRRTDWTDEFASNTGTAYLYEGTMEGYIRNLYTEKLWKYRPYYESDSGNCYYGNWVGIDPTNTNYFEPTVHTYAQINVTGNRAEVKGYAMRGTDRVTSQGFMYWSTGTASSRRNANSIPSDAKTVLASGYVMTATLDELEYETEYCCVAFVTTSEGETFYGEPQIFKTYADPDGIREIDEEPETMENEVIAVYDINGRKLSAPQKGLNIIRHSDGTSRKILAK